MATKPWACGEAFSMADCAAAPALFYAEKVLPFRSRHPHLAAYFEPFVAAAVICARVKRGRFLYEDVPGLVAELAHRAVAAEADKRPGAQLDADLLDDLVAAEHSRQHPLDLPGRLAGQRDARDHIGPLRNARSLVDPEQFDQAAAEEFVTLRPELAVALVLDDRKSFLTRQQQVALAPNIGMLAPARRDGEPDLGK